MKAIIVRHGQAIDPQEADSDEDRWLTPVGRDEVARVAQRLPKGTWTTLYTSPLVRAVQTSEVLCAAVGYTGIIQVLPALSVEYGTVEQAIVPLARAADDHVVVLVSHMPKVRMIVRHLIGASDVQSFPTAGACILQRTGTTYRLEAMVSPDS